MANRFKAAFQSRMGIVHFFVIFVKARYSSFSRALSLSKAPHVFKTLLLVFVRR